MITTDRDKNICAKYSRKIDGKVRCFECPLRKGTDNYDFRCKANSHYDRHLKEWIYDE